MRKVIRVSDMNRYIMKDVCELSLRAELEKISELDIGSISYQSLSDEQVGILAKKIGLLPTEHQNILFLRYCYNHNSSEIDKLLEIESSEGSLLYVHKMLSALMGLGDLWIDNKSIKEACNLALMEDMKDYDTMEILQEPNYSNTFRKKLKGIKIKQSATRVFRTIVKKAAVFILICLLSFSAVLTVSAETRERFFGWIVETFPKFSIFTPQTIDETENSVELTSLKINYIPAGFELVETNITRKMLIYNYSTKDNLELTLIFSSSDKARFYSDTEGAEIEELIFKESPAYIWQIDEITYLIWYQDGIQCHISANLSKDEVIKVAENISK